MGFSGVLFSTGGAVGTGAWRKLGAGKAPYQCTGILHHTCEQNKLFCRSPINYS